VSSSPEKITARALGRVLARNVAAGRPAEYPALLAETDVELAAMQERLKRDARMLRRARRQVRETRLQIEATALYSASRLAGAGYESLAADAATGLPRWHPEHPENDH
jgi:ATP-dependent exoDNAse (exonuclease V) alpha subunit